VRNQSLTGTIKIIDYCIYYEEWYDYVPLQIRYKLTYEILILVQLGSICMLKEKNNYGGFDVHSSTFRGYIVIVMC